MSAVAPGITSAAWLSEDGCYRYSLTRDWDERLGTVCWVMLNPSTADAQTDDPTIRRCIAFSQRWGYGRLVVLNLFAWRVTNPKALPLVLDPIGPANDIAALSAGSSLIVAAWGSSYPGALKRRVMAERPQLVRRGAMCLGKTASGSPRHPLYVRGDTPLVAL